MSGVSLAHRDVRIISLEERIWKPLDSTEL